MENIKDEDKSDEDDSFRVKFNAWFGKGEGPLVEVNIDRMKDYKRDIDDFRNANSSEILSNIDENSDNNESDESDENDENDENDEPRRSGRTRKPSKGKCGGLSHPGNCKY